MRDTLVVGDVHGCADELVELLEIAGDDVRVVLVGDLFTKGPDPVGVWRVLRRTGARAVLGNHDQRLLDVIEGERPHDTHGAGIVRALDAEDPAWQAWTRALPLWLQVGRYLVTHAALHPSGDLERTDRRTHLVRRRWPDDRDLDCPHWWQVYEGPPVIFGHDAARGLVRRDRHGAPWIIGLDTGCVYGGQLSGWLVGAERLIQVPAARVYKPISGPPSGAAASGCASGRSPR